MSDITEIKNLINTYFDEQKPIRFGRNFAKYWKDPQVSMEEKLDYIAELSKRNPEFFMDKIYQGIQFQFRKEPLEELLKLDEYMLRKHCLLDGEEIKTVFYGTIKDKKTTTTGRIHMTNFRIMACGTQVVQSAQKSVGRSSLIGAAIRSGVTHHRKAIRKAITRAFRQDLAEWNLAEWGYYFPVHKAKKIKPGKKSISYYLDIETEKKAISLGITIKPLRVKKQPKEEFIPQSEYVLKQIYEMLQQNA
jgi:hypothetical protein